GCDRDLRSVQGGRVMPPAAMRVVGPAELWAELETIKARDNGELRPSAVVEAARDKRNPLHSQFEWDDKVAAHEYRLSQARALIRRFEFEIPGEDGEPMVRTRAFVSVGAGRDRSYRDARDVASSDLASMVEDQLRQELQEIRDRLARFKKFEQVVRAIEQVD